MPEAAASPRKKLTSEDKEQILTLSREGLDVTSIARQLNIHGHSVNGYVSTARRRGLLQPRSTQEFPVQQIVPETFMVDPTQQPVVAAPVASAPPPHMHSVPSPQLQHQVVRDSGFTGGRPVVADSGGFSPGGELRWTVERIAPPDGVLGTHYGPFSVEDLGQIYGEATYKITRQEPGRPAIEFVKKIGPSYGMPRNPKVHAQVATPGQPGTQQRPFFQRPWDQAPAYDPQAGHIPPGTAAPRPFYQQPYYGVPQLQPFARPAPSEEPSVAAEALRQMGLQSQRLIEQQDKARQSGPESQIIHLAEAQQTLWNKRWEEERRHEEERRTAEEVKWERNRQDERERSERERIASREAHDREMQRIKQENDNRIAELKLQSEEREKRATDERKFLFDLEDKRRAIMKQEAEIQQKRLETELSSNRQEMKSLKEQTAEELTATRDATAQAIQNNQKTLDERMRERTEQLDKEYKLRERGLDKEHELNTKMLDFQKQLIETQSGDELYQMLGTLLKEGSKGWEKYVDLQKLQAMTPEAQAAAIQRGAIDGNVMGGPAVASSPVQNQDPQAPVQQRQAAAASAQRPSGNGHQAAQTAPAVSPPAGGRIETIVRDALEDPKGRETFQAIVGEWALHVEVGNDPSVFATLYLEMLRDEKNSATRLFSASFFAIMSARPWAKMLEFLRPLIDAQTLAIFQKPEAETFYEGLRGMVHHEMRGYWNNLMVAAKSKEEPPAEASQVQAPVQPGPDQESTAQVPVEPSGDRANPQAAAPAIPSQQRDSLSQAS
jgi:hypothetical protein